MKTEQKTITTLLADEGKLLRRKSDGWVAGEQVTLGYNYYESGVGLSSPRLETPDDYEEIEKPEDYEQPVVIDHGRRIAHMQRIVSETQRDINTYALTDKDALAVKDMFPEWSDKSVSVKQGERYRCDGNLWEALTDHVTQTSWKPSMQTDSLWKVVTEEHAGTLDDPIPYVQGMAFTKDLYYTQYGVTYLCILTTATGYPNDLKDLPTIVQEV